MKKSNLNKVFTGLLVCMLAVTAFALKGCKDESEEYSVPPTLKVHYSYTENELGTFLYSEKGKSWVIISDSVILLPNDTLPERPIIYEINDNEFVDDATRAEYNRLIGNTVVFSGKYENLGNEILTEYAYLVGYGYTLRGFLPVDVNISLANTRSVMENVIEAECATKPNMPPAWFFSRELIEGLDYARAYQLNVHVHVVRTSNGIGYNKDIVSSQIITKLNTDFANTNLSYTLSGSDYIDSDNFINMNLADYHNSTTFNEYISIGRVPNAINIYVMSSAPNLYYSNGSRESGQSESIVGSAFLVVESSYTNVTITHEMGHCLGLYHTHYGTSPDEDPIGSCKELVDGSNSDTCGDYITDTPADPKEWDGCIYNGSGRDANGDIYIPDPSNIMSYADRDCWNRFTQKQVERMHQVLRNSTSHHQIATQVNKGITGPTQIGSASTYTYTINVPSNATVQWSIDCSSYASGNSSPNKYTVSGTGSTITLQNRYPNALSQKYVINATVYLGTGSQRIEYHTSRTIYKISNPAQTGTLSWSSESPCGNYLGTINMSTPNNSTIKLHKGGILTFNYTDICGANSYTDTDVFNFELYNLNAIKEVGANHVFLIQPYATAPANGKIMLSLMINGMGNMFQIPVEVLPCSQIGWNSLEDSTDVEISILEDSISFVTQ